MSFDLQELKLNNDSPKKRYITLRMPVDSVKVLDRIAEDMKVSRSGLIHSMIEKYLERIPDKYLR